MDDAASVFDRTPPCSAQAEQSVLCAMLIDRAACADAFGALREGAFYWERNRRTFRALRVLYDRDDPCDVITVCDLLRDTGELEAAGGVDYLAALIDAVPTAAHVDGHAKIVADKAALRGLIEASTAAIRDAYETGTRSAAEIVGAAETRLLSISRGGASGPERVKERLWSAFDELERRQKNGVGHVTGVPTGLVDLDRMMLGLHPGQVTVVAARPSMGKTAMAMTWALNAAVGHNVPTLVFSFEMTTEELIIRSLAVEGRLDLQKLRAGDELNPEEHLRLAAAAGHVNTAPLLIDDSQDNHISSVAAKARRSVQSDKIGLIVIDYLQLMEGEGDGRREKIDAITRGCKRLSLAVQVPVVLLSQLSRGPESRPSKRPMLSDLRESGGIEQDADNVVLLYRPEYYLTAEQLTQEKHRKLIGLTELIVAKQRNGPTGVVRVHFRKESTRFENLAQTEVGPQP